MNAQLEKNNFSLLQILLSKHPNNKIMFNNNKINLLLKIKLVLLPTQILV
jgi:hypothetical protein